MGSVAPNGGGTDGGAQCTLYLLECAPAQPNGTSPTHGTRTRCMCAAGGGVASRSPAQAWDGRPPALRKRRLELVPAVAMRKEWPRGKRRGHVSPAAVRRAHPQSENYLDIKQLRRKQVLGLRDVAAPSPTPRAPVRRRRGLFPFRLACGRSLCLAQGCLPSCAGQSRLFSWFALCCSSSALAVVAAGGLVGPLPWLPPPVPMRPAVLVHPRPPGAVVRGDGQPRCCWRCHHE